MNILITGGLGYIGSNVVNQILLTTSYNVIIIDNLSNSNIQMILIKKLKQKKMN